MLNLFPKWVQYLVAGALAVFAVAEAVPMVLTSWARYGAEQAKLEAEKQSALGGTTGDLFAGDAALVHHKITKKLEAAE